MMRKLLAVTLTLIIIGFLAGNIYGGTRKSSIKGKSKNPTVKAAEFNTIQECVDTIEKNTGHSLKIITEKPSQVSGFLSNGEHFGCVKKDTESKGTYIDGWYTVK